MREILFCLGTKPALEEANFTSYNVACWLILYLNILHITFWIDLILLYMYYDISHNIFERVLLKIRNYFGVSNTKGGDKLSVRIGIGRHCFT